MEKISKIYTRRCTQEPISQSIALLGSSNDEKFRTNWKQKKQVNITLIKPELDRNPQKLHPVKDDQC